MKNYFFAAAVAAMGFAVSAAETEGLVFHEDFESVKVNSKGVAYMPEWYPPAKMKEDCEVIATREKENVCSGKYSYKLTNASEKNLIYMLNSKKTVKVPAKDEKLVLTLKAKGTGSFLIAFVNYTENNKFLVTVSASPIKGKTAIPDKKHPFDDAPWQTCYGEFTKFPEGAAKCNMAIFVHPKSEIVLYRKSVV